MTKQRLAEIERVHSENASPTGAEIRALVAAVRERDTQIAKLRAACERALNYGWFHHTRTVLAQALEETES